MSDRSVHDLHYGHFGFPSYNVDNHSWEFTRQPGQRKELRPLGGPEISVEASGPKEVERNTNNADIYRKKQFSGLYPELLIEKDVLARDLQVSQAIDIVASKYDPLRGDLLAFGRARDVHRKGSRAALAFAAIPGGKAGEALRLIRAVPARHGWGNDKNLWLRTPELDHGESGWWCGNGAPIMQVVAATPTAEDLGTYLAARTARSVHLFRPLFHRTPVLASKALNSRSKFPASRLEASPLVTLALEPNEPAISDFAFNPWYQRQFATLNQEGSWSIWDLEGRKGRRHRYKAIIAYSGRLESVDDTFEQEEDLGGQYDCWGRISWVRDVSTVAICNRRNVVVSDFRGHSARFSALSLRLGKATWILDLRLDPLDPKRMLVLTSSHVLVIQVPSLKKEDTKKSINAVVLLSWRHYREVEDTTLQITPVIQEQDCILLLRSQQNSLVTSFTYKRQVDATSTLVACSDSIELNIGPEYSPCASVMGVYAQPLEYTEYSGRETASAGQEYRKHGVQFFGLWFLSTKMELHKQFAFVWDPEYDFCESPWRNAPEIEKFSWYGKGSAQLSSRIIKDDFIIPDEYASEDEDVAPPWLNGKRYRRHRVQALPRALPTDGVDPWTVDNRRVCAHLNESIKDETEEVIAAAGSLRELLGAEADADTHHNDTLMQIVGLEVGVDDVDEGSLAFAELLQSYSLENVANNALSINVLKNAHTQFSEDVGSSFPSISATYDKVIQTWLSGLPQNTPGRVRLTNERLARQIAAQLCFSVTTIRIKQPAPQPEEAEADSQRLGCDSPLKMQSQSFDVGSDGFFPSSLPGSQPDSSQSYFHGTLPTPEATPSLVSGTTFSSGVSSINDGAMSRLRQYTTFSKQQLSLNRQMTRLLSHWEPGISPEFYDYNATRRANERAAAMNDEGLTQKQRERLHKKAMRHLKRQRRETAAHLAQTASQTPLVIHHQPHSSPGPANVPRPNFTSQLVSSQATPSQFPSTQVERGTHGGRPKKKKRRIEGF